MGSFVLLKNMYEHFYLLILRDIITIESLEKYCQLGSGLRGMWTLPKLFLRCVIMSFFLRNFCLHQIWYVKG